MDYYCNRLNDYSVNVCGVYKLSNQELDAIKHEYKDNYKELIAIYSATKEEFIKDGTKLVSKDICLVMSNVLKYELSFNCDLGLFNLEMFKEMIRNMIDDHVFKSVPLYFLYYRVMSEYTKWCYYREYRKDYYTVQDLSSLYKMTDAVNSQYEVYTLREMKAIIDSIDETKYNARISLMCLLEGLKANEILSLKRSYFMNKINHTLKISNDRSFNMSDELYKMCYEYARITATTRAVKNGNIIAAELNDSDYLLRVIKTKASENEPLKNCQLATIIKKELSELNITLEARLFRTYAMVCDLASGMSLEQVNDKYNTSYNHAVNVYRDRNIYYKMLEKINNKN